MTINYAHILYAYTHTSVYILFLNIHTVYTILLYIHYVNNLPVPFD